MARGAAHGLDQRAIAAEKPLLVRVQYRDQGHLRHIQAFAQQVDADQHIEIAQPQPSHDLHPLDGVDVECM